MQMAGLFVAPTADQDPLVNLTKSSTFKAHDDVSLGFRVWAKSNTFKAHDDVEFQATLCELHTAISQQVIIQYRLPSSSFPFSPPIHAF
jgi:hypothetical protein